MSPNAWSAEVAIEVQVCLRKKAALDSLLVPLLTGRARATFACHKRQPDWTYNPGLYKDIVKSYSYQHVWYSTSTLHFYMYLQCYITRVIKPPHTTTQFLQAPHYCFKKIHCHLLVGGVVLIITHRNQGKHNCYHYVTKTLVKCLI